MPSENATFPFTVSSTLNAILESSTRQRNITSWFPDIGENFTTVTTPTSKIDVNETELTYVTSGPIKDDVNDKLFRNIMLPSFIYTCLMLVIGVPGNGLVIYIYGFKWNRNTSRVFILALAVFDMSNCLSSIPTEMFILLNYFKFDYPYICKTTRFLTSFYNDASAVVLMAIAVDRFKRICQPLKEPVSIRTAKRVVLFAVLFGLLTSWPFLILYGTFTIHLPKQDGGVVIVAKTCLIDDGMIKTIFPLLMVMFLLFCHFGCDIALVVLYTCIGKALVRQRRTRKSLKGFTYAPEVSTNSCTNDDLDEGSEKETNKGMSIIKKIKGKFSVKRQRSSQDTKAEQQQHEHFSAVSTNTSSRVSFQQNKTSRNRDSIENERENTVFSAPKFSQTANYMKNRMGSPSRTSFVRRQVSKFSKASGSSSSSLGAMHTRKTTLMLFMVTVVFVVSFFPYCTVVILRYTDRELYNRLPNSGKAAAQVLLRSYFMNSVFNPIVYCFVSKNFRVHTIGVFKKLTCHKPVQTI